MPRYKITPADAQWAHFMWSSGVMTQYRLAKVLKVSRSHMCRLLAGERWKRLLSVK